MTIPFFLKQQEKQYEEIDGVKFFILPGKKGDNALFAAEQAKLDEISDKFAPGFTLISRIARKIATEEGMTHTEAYKCITEMGSDGDFYEEIRVKYGSDIAQLNTDLEREASAKKIAVVSVAIPNRCYQALEDDLKSAEPDTKKELEAGIATIKNWSESDTKNFLTWGYVEAVYAFLERQRLGGEKPTEVETPDEEELKKGGKDPEPTGEKSSGESKNSGRTKKDSEKPNLVVSPSGWFYKQ